MLLDAALVQAKLPDVQKAVVRVILLHVPNAP
jgi:hypothetical protein